MTNMNKMLNVYDFGACGNGIADDTAAVQRAIDYAAEKGESIYFPAGTFLCATLMLRPHVGLKGDPTWSYRDFGGAVLQLASGNSTCLLDLTGAYGATVYGLSLDGRSLHSGVHGILVDKSNYGNQEDTPCIDCCRISHFTGDGIHLNRIWCFSIRHCMISHNQANGIWVKGWDGFLLDNWLSGNKGAGYFAGEENSSVTMTGNRIEWNASGGIVLNGGSSYNITGNYMDRSGKAAISLSKREEYFCETISITGNVFYRSGAQGVRIFDKYDNSHLHFTDVQGLVCTGNTMTAGRDDNGRGEWSPDFAIVYSSLENSVIKDNVMHCGAAKKLIVDLGGHKGEVIVKDNPGCLLKTTT